QLEPNHQYAAPGIYTVTLTINNNGIPPRTFTRDIEIFEVPSAFPVDDVLLCDDNNDGLVEVNLDNFSIDVLDNQDPNQFNVTYHPTQLDAVDGTNSLAALSNFNLGTTSVFARIRNVDNQNCFDTTSFTVTIFEQPIANPVNDIILCDDNDDGDDTNGIVSIDLTQSNQEVLLTQNPTDFSITYHSSQSDADNGLNALPTPFTNTIPGSETIFVRIENVLFNDCFDTTSFEIIIDPLPEANDTTLVQCDDDILDGFTSFNLTEAEADINNLGGVSFSYFGTFADAENNVNAFNATNFNNTTNPQTIFVRVEDNVTGCFRVSNLNISVSTTTANDAFLGVCDDDTDGFVSFNLNDADPQVLNGLPPSLSVSYYLTQNDALLEVNP
ncbi:MAG: hypothetical protein RQ756_10025, partial [Flavobacteriaceae bacterium]|nr:hypothetical protein [Flavobacteriaceae bacterium]